MMKTIKVKDLVEQLKNIDQELPVAVYSAIDEGADNARNGVKVFEKDSEELPYVGGDLPNIEEDKFALIF